MLILNRIQVFLFTHFVHFIPIWLGMGYGIWYFGLADFITPDTGILMLASVPVIMAIICSFCRIPLVMLVSSPIVKTMGVVWLGCIVFAIHTHVVYTPVMMGKIKQASVSGTVKTLRYAPHKTQIRLRDVTINGTPIQGDVRFNVKTMPDIFPGVLTAKIRLYPPARPLIPDGFDFRTYAYHNGIYAFGKAVGTIYVDQPTLETFSYKITRHVYAHMSKRIGAIAVALITGNRVGMQAQDVQALRGSGLAHLLAISGLHLGIVMASVFLLVRCLACAFYPNYLSAYPIKQWAGVASLVVGFLYGMLAGFPTPTIRAFLMGAIVVLGVLSSRKSFTIRSVSLAATLILIVSPASIFSPSFQLSFSAVLGLVAVFQFVSYKHSIFGVFTHIILASTVAMVVTLPFSAYHFGTIAVYSVLANIFAVPFMSTILAPLLMMSVLEFCLLGTGYSLYMVEYGLTLLMDWAYIIYAFPHSVYQTGDIPAWCVFVFFGAMCIAIYTPYRKLGIGLGAIGIAIILALSPHKPDIIISTNGHVAIWNGEGYTIPTNSSYYFTDAIREQTATTHFTLEKCKTICIINGIVYTPDKHVNTDVICQGNHRFIIAPKTILRYCAIPSVDMGDRIINRYGGMKITLPDF